MMMLNENESRNCGLNNTTQRLHLTILIVMAVCLKGDGFFGIAISVKYGNVPKKRRS
jgi:hypothetical protein